MLRRQPTALAKPLHDTTAKPTTQLDEISAYALMKRLGVPHAPAVAIDIDARSIALPFGYPVAVKLLSAEIAHKTEVGGVVLNVGERN